MPYFTRMNAIGITYEIDSIDDDSTRIMHGKKSIVVNHNWSRINQAWYDWQQGGQFIQTAFSFLTSDEREFLLSGITKDEWDSAFEED